MSVMLRDELAFGELTQEAQDLVRKLYEHGRLGVILGVDEDSDPESLVNAYKQGWQDCVDEIEWTMPDAPSTADAKAALNRKRR